MLGITATHSGTVCGHFVVTLAVFLAVRTTAPDPHWAVVLSSRARSAQSERAKHLFDKCKPITACIIISTTDRGTEIDPCTPWYLLVRCNLRCMFASQERRVCVTPWHQAMSIQYLKVIGASCVNTRCQHYGET